MEYLIPNSLTSIIIATLLAVFVVVQIFIDFKELRHSNNLYRQLINFAKKSSERSFTVIIELVSDAAKIIPLIDHLREQKYDKLEIIVIIKKTAEKNARSIITRYRRTNKLKSIKLVQETNGMKMEDIMRRYGSGVLAMVMDSNDRLSDGFFEEASIEALYEDNHLVVFPRYQVRLDKTIASVLQAQASVLYQYAFSLFRFKVPVWPLHTGIIYNRQAILTDKVRKDVVRINISQRLFISNTASRKMIKYFTWSINEAARILRTLIGFGIFTIVTTFIIAVGIYIKPSELILLTISLFAIYTTASLLMQARIRGYSLIDRINLVLIAPFSLIFVIIVFLGGFVKLVISPFHADWRKRLSS